MKYILGFRPILFIVPVATGVFYGLLARLVFGWNVGGLFEIMSLSFIFVVPLIIGVMSTLLWPDHRATRLVDWIFVPWATTGLTLIAALLLAWEGLLCAIVWVPLFLLMASLGGIIGGVIRRKIDPDYARLRALVILAVIPFLLAPVEQLTVPAHTTNIVSTRIEINASAEAVWENIREVPTIQDHEHRFGFSYAIGFPRPVAAVLDGEGVGTMRYATFEGDVLFRELITEWNPPYRLSFTIEASQDIPPSTFDEHVVVGGQYFDVLSGTYHLETIESNRHVLHLSSEHRLSTRFNWYTRLWTNYFMNDIQKHILRIVKDRSEQAL